jgi:hypothetical protein
MNNYSVEISPTVSIRFISEEPIPARHHAAAAVKALLNYSQSGNNVDLLELAGKAYRLRYEVIVQKALSRAVLYNEAIQYIRCQRGVQFHPVLADYAIEKLLEMLDERR